jgi:hypothetical protein
MTRTLMLATLVSTALGTGAALASDDCRVPMENWQPREAMEAQAASHGWERVRVRTDDGCYKVDARDARGNEIEATFRPDTLAIVELEVEFVEGGSLADVQSWTVAPAAD